MFCHFDASYKSSRQKLLSSRTPIFCLLGLVCTYLNWHVWFWRFHFFELRFKPDKVLKMRLQNSPPKRKKKKKKNKSYFYTSATCLLRLLYFAHVTAEKLAVFKLETTIRPDELGQAKLSKSCYASLCSSGIKAGTRCVMCQSWTSRSRPARSRTSEKPRRPWIEDGVFGAKWKKPGYDRYDRWKKCSAIVAISIAHRFPFHRQDRSAWKTLIQDGGWESKTLTWSLLFSRSALKIGKFVGKFPSRTKWYAVQMFLNFFSASAGLQVNFSAILPWFQRP